MKAYRHYGTTLEHVSQCLRPVVAALEEMRPTLQRLAEEYSAQIADTDLETYLRKESGFQLKDDVQYQLRPLLISPSANIFFDMAAAGSENIIYQGGQVQKPVAQHGQDTFGAAAAFRISSRISRAVRPRASALGSSRSRWATVSQNTV